MRIIVIDPSECTSTSTFTRSHCSLFFYCICLRAASPFSCFCKGVQHMMFPAACKERSELFKGGSSVTKSWWVLPGSPSPTQKKWKKEKTQNKCWLRLFKVFFRLFPLIPIGSSYFCVTLKIVNMWRTKFWRLFYIVNTEMGIVRKTPFRLAALCQS